MDVMHACRCCLRCPSDKDLETPYTYLGKTEIYADMIKECFDIHLVLGGSGSCGICSTCVGRLRDASDFKLQVQRSHAELQALLVKAESAVKPEQADDSADDDSVLDMLYEDPLAKSETDDVMSDGHSSAAGCVFRRHRRPRQGTARDGLFRGARAPPRRRHCEQRRQPILLRTLWHAFQKQDFFKKTLSKHTPVDRTKTICL
ncbi:uncharacterized protein LOC133530190 isoform X2 [Cydia pomonella]|uniref:uncharacterized protein LOC133530190 isoform X2 n=1 Tax=Cydia pomonella TaxID=82600 RepID=UPI002ADDA8D7|nr:uncharacterized protein LOC133530190 isoform X2 [Cydia pomonella]